MLFFRIKKNIKSMTLYFYLSLSKKGELIFPTVSPFPSWSLPTTKLIVVDAALVIATLDSSARPILTVLFNLTPYLSIYILIINF